MDRIIAIIQCIRVVVPKSSCLISRKKEKEGMMKEKEVMTSVRCVVTNRRIVKALRLIGAGASSLEDGNKFCDTSEWRITLPGGSWAGSSKKSHQF